MPLAAIGIGLGTALSGGAVAGASIYAAHKGAGAAKEAARTESAAATRAAELQAKGETDRLAFERTQAGQDQANWQAAMDWNVGQYNTREANMTPYRNAGAWANTTLANLIGGPSAGAAVARPYTPVAPPQAIGPAGGSAASVDRASFPSVTPASGAIGPQVAAYFKARGVTPYPTSVQYWESKWPELVARGQQIGNPNYAMDRLAAADEFARSGPTTLNRLPMSGAPMPPAAGTPPQGLATVRRPMPPRRFAPNLQNFIQPQYAVPRYA